MIEGMVWLRVEVTSTLVVSSAELAERYPDEWVRHCEQHPDDDPAEQARSFAVEMGRLLSCRVDAPEGWERRLNVSTSRPWGFTS